MNEQSDPGKSIIEYADLLIELHRLIAAGKGDESEADAIRDAMDPLWYQMSENQIEAINGLSADLYTLGQNRPEPQRPSQELVSQLRDRISSGDWRQVLDFVRDHESALSPMRVAVLRGLAWSNIQVFEAAIEFLKEAMRVSNGNKEARLLLLSCLVRAGRHDDAVRIAAESTDQSALELATSM